MELQDRIALVTAPIAGSAAPSPSPSRPPAPTSRWATAPARPPPRTSRRSSAAAAGWPSRSAPISRTPARRSASPATRPPPSARSTSSSATPGSARRRSSTACPSSSSSAPSHLRAPFVLTQAVLPAMRRRRFGRLLYVGSTAARVGGVVGPHYAASKAGLEGVAHGYASRLAREGITANVLAPALVETEMIAANPAVTPDRIPVGRFGRPEETAAVAVAVLSNPYVTGQTIQVNGGVYFT